MEVRAWHISQNLPVALNLSWGGGDPNYLEWLEKPYKSWPVLSTATALATSCTLALPTL